MNLGLLNFNGPQRVRPLLANREEKEAADEEQDDEDKEKLQVDTKAVMVFSSSSLDEHIIEYLPPTLHKGNVTQATSLTFIVLKLQCCAKVLFSSKLAKVFEGLWIS